MYPVHVLVARRGASSITIYDDSSVDMRGKIVDAIAGGGSGIVPSHGDNHVNGTDDVPIVTASVKGLMPPNDQASELATTGSPKFVKVSGSGGVGGDLVLESTPDATKGKIYLGANSAYNEVSDYFGIGTPTPQRKFHVYSTTGSSTGYFQAAATNGVANFKFVAGGGTASSWAMGTGGSATEVRYAGKFFISANAGAISILTLDGTNAFSGFGQISPTARIHAKGSTSDNSAYALKLDDIGDSSLLSVRNDGFTTITGELNTVGPRIIASDTITDNYTVANDDPEIMYVDVTATGKEITFPLTQPEGSKRTFISVSDYDVTINGNAGEQGINGTASIVLPAGLTYSFHYTTTYKWRFSN